MKDKLINEALTSTGKINHHFVNRLCNDDIVKINESTNQVDSIKKKQNESMIKNYEQLIKTVSEIINNEDIITNGLTLVYTLDDKRHKDVDEYLFYKSNPEGTGFEHRDLIEVEIGGVMVRFIKKDLEG